MCLSKAPAQEHVNAVSLRSLGNQFAPQVLEPAPATFPTLVMHASRIQIAREQVSAFNSVFVHFR
jgi:hypothetical protein